MKSVKILHIVIAKVWGGGEQYVYDVSKAMGNKGGIVYVALDKHNNTMKNSFAKVSNTISCNLYIAAGLFSILKLVGFIKKNKIDILCCHSGHAMILCILLKIFTGIKLVSFKHNAISAKKDLYHMYQRKLVDAFICVSNLVYDLQCKDLTSEEKNKIYLVYNGIDTLKFDQSAKSRDNSKFIIGYAGRIANNKGIDILLQAFLKFSNRNENAKLVLAGTDEKDYLKYLLNYIHENKLESKIDFLGHVDDMNSFYKNLDVFVLPSVVKEAFGLVVCEAMYCNIPVITTDSGAQKEIVENGINGIIIRAGNIEDLANALEDIYKNYEKYQEMASAGRERISKLYTIDRCVDNLNVILRAL